MYLILMGMFEGYEVFPVVRKGRELLTCPDHLDVFLYT